MGTQAMGPLAGIGWLKNAVNLGRHNPKAIFGGAALFLLVALALMIPLMLLHILVLVKLALTGAAAVAVSLLATLAMLALFPPFMIGYLRVVDAVETGRVAHATDVFAAFKDGPAWLRAVGFMFLLLLLHYGMLLAALAMLAPEFIAWYAEALQMSPSATAQPAAVPQGLWLALALIIPTSLFFYAVQAIGFGQIALRGRGISGAMADGAAGAAKNVLPLLLFVVAAVVAGLVFGLVLILVVMLLAFVAKLAGTWLVVTLAVLAVPVYLGLMLAMYVVMFGVMYHLWRDVCGDGSGRQSPAEAVAT